MCHNPDTPITVHTGLLYGRPIRLVSADRTIYPLTPCCQAAVTYSSAVGASVLCCKGCWKEVPEELNAMASVNEPEAIAKLLVAFGVPRSDATLRATQVQVLARVQDKVTHVLPESPEHI